MDKHQIFKKAISYGSAPCAYQGDVLYLKGLYSTTITNCFLALGFGSALATGETIMYFVQIYRRNIYAFLRTFIPQGFSLGVFYFWACFWGSLGNLALSPKGVCSFGMPLLGGVSGGLGIKGLAIEYLPSSQF